MTAPPCPPVARARQVKSKRVFITTMAVIIDSPKALLISDLGGGRGAAGMLKLGNLNLYNEEICIGLPYLFEFLNLFTFIYLFNSDHRGR